MARHLRPEHFKDVHDAADSLGARNLRLAPSKRKQVHAKREFLILHVEHVSGITAGGWQLGDAVRGQVAVGVDDDHRLAVGDVRHNHVLKQAAFAGPLHAEHIRPGIAVVIR
ncbi:MAG: hypothetical protein H0U76_29695 [Ktedonobacteraceae bacterium]|nr:hypothetical protein [Ktedonobacteraceae bacterium]